MSGKFRHALGTAILFVMFLPLMVVSLIIVRAAIWAYDEPKEEDYEP